jgi:class 3 adenylate cyclase
MLSPQERARQRARGKARRSYPGSHDTARESFVSLKPVRVRIGLTSGLVVVGNVGAPGRINCTLIGDTVNRAQEHNTEVVRLYPPEAAG